MRKTSDGQASAFGEGAAAFACDDATDGRAETGRSVVGAHSKPEVAGEGDGAVLEALARAARAQRESAGFGSGVEGAHSIGAVRDIGAHGADALLSEPYPTKEAVRDIGAHGADAVRDAETPAAPRKKAGKRTAIIATCAVACLVLLGALVCVFLSSPAPGSDAAKTVEKALGNARSANSSTIAQLVENDMGESFSRYGIDAAALASWLKEDMSYTVTKLDEQKNTATVTVKATCHDLSQFQECVTAVAKEAASSADFQNVTSAEDAYKLIGAKAFERAKSESPASKNFEVRVVKQGENWELTSEDEAGIFSRLWG